MLTAFKRRLLRTRSRPVQIFSQFLRGSLNRSMERVFADEGIDWNGHASCLLLSFDVDFPEDAMALPEIVEQLGQYSIGANFACVGRWVEDYPDVHRAVLEKGYELFNHTYSHPELVNSPDHFVSEREDLSPRKWQDLSLPEKEEEIRRCQECVGEILGYRMRGFRAPHFGNVEPEELYPILKGLELDYSTSMLAPRATRLGLPVTSGELLEIPVTTCPEHPFTSLDSWHAFYARGGWHRDDFGDLLQKRLRKAAEFHGLTNIYLDPKDRERLDFDRLFAFFASLEGDCWVPSYSEFCEWHSRVYGEDGSL